MSIRASHIVMTVVGTLFISSWTIFGQAAPSAMPVVKTEKAAPAKTATVLKQVSGSIAAVEAGSIQVTVTKGTATTVDTLTTTEKTTVLKGKAALTLADLKAGDLVSVKYKVVNGQKDAVKITISEPKAVK